MYLLRLIERENLFLNMEWHFPGNHFPKKNFKIIVNKLNAHIKPKSKVIKIESCL